MQTSKQTPLVNEPVMNNIKKRLKDAYDNVKFYASKTWTNDHYLYQKANQELYARHIKIQETFAEDVTRARTVQDSIPQSKLAQYSNYEYDEARELSYTPNGGDVIFHYPCRQKKEAITEPWMLPEVEQLFIWLTYSRDFNLLRYRDLVEFEPTDRSKQTCTLKDFHKVDPRFYETFERTPGKPRFTKSDCITDVDLQQLVPPLLNLNTFEDMTVKMKIDLDTIKNIWKTSRADDVILPKKFQVFKSSFNNLFVNENSRSAEYLQHPEYFNLSNVPYHFNELQERANDFRNLQNLAELLKKLKKSKVATVKRPHVTNSKSETDTKVTPTRRLYSDVVQGLVSNKNSSPKIPDVSCSSTTLGQSSSFKDLPKVDETCSHKFGSAVRNRPPTPPASWLEQSWTAKPEKKLVDHTYTSQAKYAGGKSFLNNAANYTDASFSSPGTMNNCNATFVNNNNYQNYFGGSNVIPNEYHPNDVYGTYANNTAQNPNIYGGGFCPNGPYQYPQNNVYCNSFTNANFPSNAYAPYGNQLPTSARTFMQQKQNAIHFNNSGQQWIMHQYRTPSIYNVAHFPPQPYFLLPPQPPKQQRWMQSPHYMRPSVPQTYHHVGITPPHTPPQNWGVQNQNLYKTNSTQHICTPPNQHHHQVFENSSSMDLRQKYKNRKINSQINLRRNRSPENLHTPECANKFKTKPAAFKKSCDVISGKTLIKPASSADSIDLKYVIKNKESVNVEQKTLLCNSSSTISKDFESLPVTASTSDELERQALDEYQSSNESFYKELERQAEEQYEGSENSFGPPNDELYFGGLAWLHEFLNFCVPGLLCKTLAVYVYL